MEISFVANVGLRDIHVDRRDIPSEPRALGEMIMMDNWKSWRNWKKDISLPVIGKALDRITRMEGELSSIILFATENPDAPELNTEPLAQIVKRFIAQTMKSIPEDIIKIVTIRHNPHDYDLMMAFYRNHMRQLEGQGRVYLEVTGGTPAMAFMLLWQGVETLQDRVLPLYVPLNGKVPQTLNIGERLQFEAVADDYQDMIQIHQYQAGLNVLEAHESLCRKLWLYYDVIKTLTTYARQRINFNFDDAEKTLWGVEQPLAGKLRNRVIDLSNEMVSRDHNWLLREEYLALDIGLRNGAYKDALSSIYSFIEGALRAYLIKLGVEITDDNKLNHHWLTSNAHMNRALSRNNIDLTKILMRQDLQNILVILSKDIPEADAMLKRIKKLHPLVILRHASIHSHAGVSRNQLEESYDGGIDGIMRDLNKIYEKVTGQAIGRNTFDIINDLILDLTKISV